jgi:glycosyltransferase involved in cell wall biosynthesis
MKVSTIIPYYCHGTSIGRAVASVWNQTIRPYEIIIVDDGTPEKEAVALEHLAEIYPADTLKIIRLPFNQGPGKARNIGWSEARGDCVAFLDADDIWHPQKIALQLQVIGSHSECHGICGGTAFARSSSEIEYGRMDSRLYRLRPIDLLLHNPVSTRTVMLRRDFKLRFAEHKKNSEDYQLFLTAVLMGFNLYFCNTKLAYCFKAEYGEDGLSASLQSAHKGHVDSLQRVKNQGLISPALYLLLRLLAQAKHYRRRLFVHLGINRREEPFGIFLKKYIPFFRFK